MKVKILLVHILLLYSLQAFSIEDNKELAKIYEQDQLMRTDQNLKNWPLYQPLEERAFRIKIFELITYNKIKTANDFYRASIVLVHAPNNALENYILAAKFAERAIEMGHKNGKFALDAAVSHYSLSNNLPSPEWTLYAVDDKLMTNSQLNTKLNQEEQKKK
jgi:hypothetical protein